MTITSGLFNSVNGDRRYDAKWFAQYFATFIGNGVFPNPSTGLQVVEGTNMQTIVKPGQGWINGYFIVNDANHILSHEVADGVLKRIDRVVMRLNYLTRKIEIEIKKGTFASSPVAPALQRNADAYELALADVLINNGATVITQARITDQRLNTAICGIVHGVVDQVDTTTIFNQYQSWFEEITGNTVTEIDNWQAQQELEFNNWFASIQDILDGDIAANLANRISSLEGTVATHLADYVSHPANGGTTAGTATAYTCSSSPNPAALVDKIGIVITAHIDSGVNPTLKWGSLTAKSIKKTNGNAANLKKDGLYTLRYNSVNDSFILQGEGGEYGTAVAGDVRKTKTIGREDGVVQGTLDLTNLVATNIKSGVVIDGITGNLITGVSPGDYVIGTNSTLLTGSGVTPIKLKQFRMNTGGLFRVTFNLNGSSDEYGNHRGYGRIYVNGVAKGTIRSVLGTSYVSYTEDIQVDANDLIQMYLWGESANYYGRNTTFTIGILLPTATNEAV